MYEDELPCGFGGEDLPPILLTEDPSEIIKNCCESCSCESCDCKPAPKPVEPNPNRLTKLCFKCKVNRGALLHKNEPMCRECSLRNVEYKCRVNLQNKIKIKQTDRLLVGLSGGMNSVCLMNVLKQLQIRFQKHLLFEEIEAIHVDLSALWESHKQGVEQLVRFSKERDFRLTIIPIESLYTSNPERLNQLFDKFQEGADEADLIDIMVERILVEQASQRNMLLVKGTVGQRVAANIFKYIVKGNGGSIGELSFRHGNILTPLREHLNREVQFYYHCKLLDQYAFPQSSVKQVKLSHDLNNLLEDFIDSLQDTYSHTCPTILRTSEKIKLADEGSLKCSWCLSPTNGKLCRRCTLIHGHWKGELPIEHYLPPCFQT